MSEEERTKISQEVESQGSESLVAAFRELKGKGDEARVARWDSNLKS